MIFSSNLLPDLFARAFAPIPDVPIWAWAEGPPAPFTLRKSPEPAYRSSLTPWTRRGQDLQRRPIHNGRTIRRLGIRKSSQSGFTEGCILNPIRWLAKHRPRNCVISLDSQKEADELRERLLPTLKDLGQELFTDDEDDLQKYRLRLLGMTVWLAGSFSPGGFSNKFAPRVFNDEVDIYGEVTQEGNTIDNYWSRVKKADDAFQVVISKPANADGPIDTFYKMGNQEQWEVECPHHGCHERQVLEWDRVTFSHCKDLTGFWDFERMLNETWYTCKKCGGHILNHHKDWMNPRGLWVPTAKGDPEIVTQTISDLPSTDTVSTFGHLAKEFITAHLSGDRTKIQTFQQQRLGQGYEVKIQKIESLDVLKLRAPYRRYTIPHAKCILTICMDIGAYVNTRWEVFAWNAAGELWLIDWGAGEGPASILKHLTEKRYRCIESGVDQPILYGVLDARHRTDECYQTCLCAPRQLFPSMGLKPTIGARSVEMKQVPGQPDGFGRLDFVKRDAMFDLYIDRIKDLKPPRIYWPEDVDTMIVNEHCAERLIHNDRHRVVWEEDHGRANHAGDATCIAITFVDWLLKARRARILADALPERPAPAP